MGIKENYTSIVLSDMATKNKSNYNSSDNGR